MKTTRVLAELCAALVIFFGAPGVPRVFAEIANQFQQPLGYQQFTSVSISVASSLASSAPSTGTTGIPQGSNSAVIYIESAGIRWRDDGTAPTSAIGNPVSAGQAFVYTGALPKLQFIGQSASPTVNVTYYQ